MKYLSRQPLSNSISTVAPLSSDFLFKCLSLAPFRTGPAGAMATQETITSEEQEVDLLPPRPVSTSILPSESETSKQSTFRLNPAPKRRSKPEPLTKVATVNSAREKLSLRRKADNLHELYLSPNRVLQKEDTTANKTDMQDDDVVCTLNLLAIDILESTDVSKSSFSDQQSLVINGNRNSFITLIDKFPASLFLSRKTSLLLTIYRLYPALSLLILAW